jgi:hypothetical protein
MDPALSQCDPGNGVAQAVTPLAVDHQRLFSRDRSAELLLAKRPPKCGDGVLEEGELCETGDTGPSCAALGVGSNTEPLPCNSTCTGWDTSSCQ